MRISELVDHYVLQLEADGRSPHTIGQARRHGRLAAAFFGERTVAEISHQDIARLLTSAMAMRTPRGEAKKPTSMNGLRSSVRCLFGFAHDAGYSLTNAARLVRRARCGTPMPRALSDGDRAKLLYALNGASTEAEHRDRALIHLLLGAGLRIGSALALDIADVDLDAGELRLRHMKNGDEATAFMPRETAEVLRAQIDGRLAGPVFIGAHGRRLGARQALRRLEEWARRAGLDRGVRLHDLRHTFATRVYACTGDLLVTGRALSHRSLASTAIYAQASPARIQEAVRRATA